MGKFRKKPVEIEAVRFEEVDKGDVLFDAIVWPAWLNAGFDSGSVTSSEHGLYIETLEGVMFANPGDWIIRGVSGELYPCKPDIFELSYEAVA